MLTIRAKLKNGKITLLDQVALPMGEADEYQILITFLDTDIKTVFGVESIQQDETISMFNQYKLGLTNREVEVLKLAEKGLTNEQISEQLELGHGTVRNYLSSIYEKLKVANRTGAISKAKDLGLLD